MRGVGRQHLRTCVAAILVDRFIVRGFLGSPRAWLVSGMFAVAFTVLVGGKVLTEGTPTEIAADPRVREVYLGEGEHA